MGYMPQRVHEPDAVLERVAETCEACDQTATGRDIKDGDSRKDGNTRGTVVQQHK